MSGDDLVTITAGGFAITADLSDEPAEDRPAIIEELTVSTQIWSAVTGMPAGVSQNPGLATELQGNPYATADLGLPGLDSFKFDGPTYDLGTIDAVYDQLGANFNFRGSQDARVANRDAATAAATIAAENKRFNDAISAFDREVLLQNRKFEDEARRLSDIAAQTQSQYDIQAAQRAVAIAERNKAEQAANFELQMDSFENTQGDFFRETSTGADPSRAMRSAFVGNQSPLAQYAQRVQDLATASNQEKLDIQQERISEADRQAQAAIQDRQDAAWALELKRQKDEEQRLLAGALVGQSTGAQRATTDQRNKAVQIKLDGGDWEGYMASLNLNTVSTDIVAGSSAVDTASDNAAGASGTPAGAGGTPGGTPGGEDDTGAGNSNYGWGGIKMSPLSTPI